MSAPDLEKLKAHVSGQDLEELNLACDGKASAMKAYKERPGKETKADYDAARDLHQETLERLWREHFPDDAPAPEGERFRNRKQAFDWLKAQGYKVSQGKFYGDCEAGSPTVHKDGSVSRYHVMQYGQQLDVERKGSDQDSQKSDEADLRKRIAEAEIAERKNDREKRQMDSEWLHRSDALVQMAAIMGKTRAALRRRFYTGYQELIKKCGGDHARGNEVYEYLDNMLRQAFNEVAGNGKIEGTLIKHKATDADTAV
ncbi:MAG: hypothetical protein A2079_05210 [Geobacteraceae bacterium GWC2_48_7]|nr:MAG: hypothetical protein A2079_05210 [Geobacteraceae bacterium GWC2_48_7]